jgi:hypothetical protein
MGAHVATSAFGPVAKRAAHLAKRLGPVGKEHEREEAEGGIERPVREPQGLRVHHVGVHVREVPTRRPRTHLVNHLGGKIDGRNARDMRRRQKGQRPGTRGYVENVIRRAQAREAHALVRVFRKEWRDVRTVGTCNRIPNRR